ncbi:hypothetical protein HYH02_004626 [Chlamydomonas schloesseri]|uniref:phytol kinase n=1 Tax=Chlamydomonas schloesseri TaxID=2026947 RepID=A0A836B8Z5_9CHLO|nr:hypothetical protein HYH02_004626 [Chlamydomonas schloesseri]|eukprot:KAG2450789.1 hypothetical protein HYH02_004626 [Chlamydomonas schloesseri]
MAPKSAARRRNASVGQSSREEPRKAADTGPFVACVRRLAELVAQAGGSLRSLHADVDNLRAAAQAVPYAELAVQLREHASREFWHAALAVHAYSIRDCRALYEQLRQLDQQHQRSAASLDAGPADVTACLHETARTVALIKALSQTCFTMAATDGPAAAATPANAAHMLALIRCDTLQVCASILQTMTRIEAPPSRLPNDAATVSVLLVHIDTVSAIACERMRKGDTPFAVEWARAMAGSGILEHACRAILQLRACVAKAREAVAPAADDDEAARPSARRTRAVQQALETTNNTLEECARGPLFQAVAAVGDMYMAFLRLQDPAATSGTSTAGRAGTGPSEGSAAGSSASAAASLLPPAVNEELLTALGSVLRGRSLHFLLMKGLVDAGNASVAVRERFVASLNQHAQRSSKQGVAALSAKMQQGTPDREDWMGLPPSQRMSTADFERMGDETGEGGTGTMLACAKRDGLPIQRTYALFGACLVAARWLWKVTGMQPAIGANQPAGAAGSSNSSSSGASSGTRVAVGGSGAAAAAGGKSAVVRRPFNTAHVCAAVGHGLEAIIGMRLMLHEMSSVPFGYQADMSTAVQLLCQLAMRLRGREAVRLLGTVWTCGALVQKLMAASMLGGCILTAAELEESVVPALEAMGDLLLHKYDKEKNLQFPGHPSGCGMSLDYAIGSRAIFQLHASLSKALLLPSITSSTAAAEFQGRLRVALTDCFLRRSCALPALLTYSDPKEVGGLLVTLRQAMFVSDAPAGGPGPGASRAPSAPAAGGVQAQMVRLVVQLLEQVAAVCFHSPPPPPPPGSADETKGPAVPAGKASQNDGSECSAAARLTDSAKRDVPAESLQQMWAAAQPGNGAADAAAVARANATRMPVYAVLQLLPAVMQSGQVLVAELSEAHKDFTVGLSRVFLAAAVHGLSAMQRAAHAARAAGREMTGAFTGTESESWLLLLALSTRMYQWLARALGVSTAKRWPEGHAAALDVLEVLTVHVPEEELVLWVQLRTGKDAVAAPTGAPASPSVPVIQLGEGWLQQQGRHNLAAALKAKGCHLSAAAGSGGAGGGSSSSPATAAAAVDRLLDDVSRKHHLARLPRLVCPMDAMRGMDVTYNFRPCSFPGCTRVPACQIPGAAPGGEPVTMRCGRCRVESYCGAECQRAHWREGHKVECQRLGLLRKDLEAETVLKTSGGLGGVGIAGLG